MAVTINSGGSQGASGLGKIMSSPGGQLISAYLSGGTSLAGKVGGPAGKAAGMYGAASGMASGSPEQTPLSGQMSQPMSEGMDSWSNQNLGGQNMSMGAPMSQGASSITPWSQTQMPQSKQGWGGNQMSDQDMALNAIQRRRMINGVGDY